MIGDLRHALRALRKAPIPTLVAVLTLTFCIGANAAIFSVIRGTLLNRLPYADLDRFVGVSETWPMLSGPRPISHLNYQDWVAQNRVFEQMAAATRLDGDVTLTDDRDVPTYLTGFRVTASYFDLYSLHAFLGRTFSPDDERPGSHVVLLSHRLWVTRFGADSAIVGRTIDLDGLPHTVIGVMPAGTSVDLHDPELWRPLIRDPNVPRQRRDGWALAKLKRGVTITEARADMNTIAARLARDYPDANKNYGIAVEPSGRPVDPNFEAAVYLLFAAVVAVLLIGCANLANVSLARAVARDREVAVRAALGATGWRLARPFVLEQVILAVLGGAGGLLLAHALLQTFLQWIPLTGLTAVFPPDTAISIDLPVCLFTFAVSVLTGIACALAPVKHALGNRTVLSLKSGGYSATADGSQRALQHGLVIAQVAVAFVLLMTSGLLLRGLSDLSHRVERGFDGKNVLTASVPFPYSRFQSGEAFNQYLDAVEQRVRALPGVFNVAFTIGLPTQGPFLGRSFQLVGRPAAADRPSPFASFKVVSPDYFQVVGMHLVRGRLLQADDRGNAPLVVVVNQTLARTFLGGTDAIGQRLQMRHTQSGFKAEDRVWTVVGLVADEGVSWLEQQTPQPILYLAREQEPYAGFQALVVKTAGDPDAFAAPLRAAVATVDSRQALADLTSLDDLERASLASVRLRSSLAGLLSIVAVALAALGLYGVMTYAVTQRTRELGVRSALGATPAQLLRLVIGRGLWLTGLGLVVGVIGGTVVTRVLRAFLTDVGQSDPLLITGVASAVALLTLGACYGPARWAARADPLVVFKAE